MTQKKKKNKPKLKTKLRKERCGGNAEKIKTEAKKREKGKTCQ